MKLPRFTFIVGETPPYPLATLIASRFASMLVEDFNRPLREATLALFYHNDVLGNDLLEKSNDRIMPPNPTTVADFVAGFANSLKSVFGDEALGEIALRDYISQGWEDVFDHTLYRDTTTPNDTAPFCRAFGPAHCLVINTGPLTSSALWTCKVIWLAMPEPIKQLEALDHELGAIL